MFIAGMWFQDLFNYDFRRTEMCIIPYATQQGEISFCAYNTGIGWRKIIENMYKNATVAQWYKTHGKHEIYAAGKAVNLGNYEHSLVIDADDAARVKERDHDDVPVTAADEDRARRKCRSKRRSQGSRDLRRAGAEEGATDGGYHRLRWIRSRLRSQPALLWRSATSKSRVAIGMATETGTLTAAMETARRRRLPNLKWPRPRGTKLRYQRIEHLPTASGSPEAVAF